MFEDHLGALPGIFENSECDDNYGPAPSFSTPDNGSTVSAYHGAFAQLPCGILHLGHRTVTDFSDQSIYGCLPIVLGLFASCETLGRGGMAPSTGQVKRFIEKS